MKSDMRLPKADPKQPTRFICDLKRALDSESCLTVNFGEFGWPKLNWSQFQGFLKIWDEDPYFDNVWRWAVVAYGEPPAAIVVGHNPQETFDQFMLLLRIRRDAGVPTDMKVIEGIVSHAKASVLSATGATLQGGFYESAGGGSLRLVQI